MLEVSEADRAAFSSRICEIDYAAVGDQHLLGSYNRSLPVKLSRMMENARDWEHLPFVHPTSFADIALVDAGRWGWRCKTSLPGQGGEQLVELLVDADNHYWATTIVEGAGAGAQIHTKATARDEGGIGIDVRFFMPQKPETEQAAGMLLGYLQTQYARLYDEDEALMLGRQEALDERRLSRASARGDMLDAGPVAELDRSRTYEWSLGGASVVGRFHEDRWVVHGARCPHALGPLGGAKVGKDGHIVCPWHGYGFDLATGEEDQGRCGALALYSATVENARLIIRSGKSAD